MNRSKLKSDLHKAGLDHLASDIISLARSSIRAISRTAGMGSGVQGVSRLGGLPVLPAGFAWPRWKDAPMSFVAQIRLEETARSDESKLLPRRGSLAFFFDSRQETYGADPADRGGWQVFYTDEDPGRWQPLEVPADLPAQARFNPCSLAFKREITLPSAPLQVRPDLAWTREEFQKYEVFQSGFPNPESRAGYHHRLLGYPDQIQDDMQLECALASNGIRSLDDPQAARYNPEKNDWLLLFQVDSDADAGMRWGSTGMIYFWIKRQDLQACAFDRAWLVLQSD